MESDRTTFGNRAGWLFTGELVAEIGRARE
jgi:hypothetical protein